jgi:hypothetical protein
MTRVLSVDDQESEFTGEDTQKLAEVLQRVTAELPPNRVVAGIVLNGREIPKYEQTRALENTLREVKQFQVRTADAEIWAATGMDIALSRLERVQRSLLLAAELFRDEIQEEEGHIFLGRCLDGLERFLETIMITRCALKLDFNRIEVEGMSLARLERDFGEILEGIIGCQERQDFIGIADKVEYELLTNIHLWTAALQKLRLSALSNA